MRHALSLYTLLLLVLGCRPPSTTASAPTDPSLALALALAPAPAPASTTQPQPSEPAEPVHASPRPAANPRLLELFQADQADRRPGPDGIDWSVVNPRDRAREAEVLALVEDGAPQVADDWYHAAMIMQHGQGDEPIERARAWALRAVELDPDHAAARWLAAAAKDRLQMRRGLPQPYGTQFVRRDDGRWELYEVDPTVTDEERARWGVPPLAEARRRAEQMNEQ